MSQAKIAVPEFMSQRLEDEHPTSPQTLTRWRWSPPPEPEANSESDPHGLPQHSPGAKLDSGKCVAGVLSDFALALQAVADVGDFGARKYTRGGWQSVPNAEERYFDAMWRHLLRARHEELDPDSKLPHFAHLAWNLLAVLELQGRSKL